MDLLINSDESLEIAIQSLRDQYADKKYVKAKLSYGRQRTPTQNASAHVFFDHVAAALNDCGYEQHKFFKDGFFVQWNQSTVKENIWRPVQIAVCGEVSTTKPTRAQYGEIYEHVNRLLSGKGIHVAWPEKDRDDATKTK